MDKDPNTDRASSSDAGGIRQRTDDFFDRSTEIRQLRHTDTYESAVDGSYQQAASSATGIRKKTDTKQLQVSLKRLENINLPGNLDLVGISADRVRQKSLQTLHTDHRTSIQDLESDLNIKLTSVSYRIVTVSKKCSRSLFKGLTDLTICIY